MLFMRDCRIVLRAAKILRGVRYLCSKWNAHERATFLNLVCPHFDYILFSATKLGTGTKLNVFWIKEFNNIRYQNGWLSTTRDRVNHLAHHHSPLFNRCYRVTVKISYEEWDSCVSWWNFCTTSIHLGLRNGLLSSFYWV